MKKINLDDKRKIINGHDVTFPLGGPLGVCKVCGRMGADGNFTDECEGKAKDMNQPNKLRETICCESCRSDVFNYPQGCANCPCHTPKEEVKCEQKNMEKNIENWEIEFDEKFTDKHQKDVLSMLTSVEDIKSFIRQIEQRSYERGKSEKYLPMDAKVLSQFRKRVEHQALEMVLESLPKRIGMDNKSGSEMTGYQIGFNDCVVITKQIIKGLMR